MHNDFQSNNQEKLRFPQLREPVPSEPLAATRETEPQRGRACPERSEWEAISSLILFEANKGKYDKKDSINA